MKDTPRRHRQHSWAVALRSRDIAGEDRDDRLLTGDDRATVAALDPDVLLRRGVRVGEHGPFPEGPRIKAA